MKAQELKEKYLRFFESKKHAIIASAPLVPQGDSSVLFTTAGMQPLVPYLLGQAHPKGTRLVDVQKCLRTVDFENIGDDTHHTFFEMLGNWSLGDYFKKESIAWSYEFLTSPEWLGLNVKDLAFTVYEGDDQVPRDTESYDLWRELGVSEERLAFLGEDNFWSAGETGPCGPSSEIFFWTGTGDAPEKFDAEDERWVEIWNNVFMSYNRKEGGVFEELASKNVDTGMGFERTLAVLNGESSAYETDLFSGLLTKISELSGSEYDTLHKRAMRIVADHVRAATFILGEGSGVIPSNVDQGYVLRRLIRRAIRFGRQVGIEGAFMGTLARVVITQYASQYPELEEHKAFVLDEFSKEEEKFAKTLEKGLREFERMAESGDIDGKGAFLLFQSYGFPLEMVEELSEERGISVDTEGFFAAYKEHKDASRQGAEKKFKGGLADLSDETVRLHTATHLLNEALRRVVDSSIKQRGSNITPERLRFDFSFERKLTPEEIKAVEDEVNRVIGLSLEVERREMAREEAEQLGAQAEFGAKYPDRVSVYFIGDYSKEFCGGPHVENTSQIGTFKIVKEKSSSAGVRRIKAVVD